ncbi:olfactory receptor 6N2-like [Melanotaenia boesemani]|uniref:olfactory receptor 6N2-like n=1 Tax=Melanotaenia boesemani TaxID=1250792 RepID=UPI001C05108F|nr:olfactory receptor 6N2-like [Melanotaenia boesemani]
MENNNTQNVTYITFDGYVDLHKFRYLYFVILLTAYVLIIFCNVTIGCLIWTHKSLHEPMYIFIAALLFNSVVFSINIYPKLLIDILSVKQIISYSACLFQFFLFYSLAGSEFLLLAAMAYDRYVSICKPLQYPVIMRKSTVTTCLCSAWLLPACFIAVLVTLSANMQLCKFNLNGILCNNSIYSLHCVSSETRSIFGAVALIMSALFPLLFILFTYTRILIISYHSCKEVRRKAGQTCVPHLLVLISFFCLCAFDVIIVRVGSSFPKVVRLTMMVQSVLYHPLFNPIIYGVKMTEISKQLKKFFCQTKVI